MITGSLVRRLLPLLAAVTVTACSASAQSQPTPPSPATTAPESGALQPPGSPPNPEVYARLINSQNEAVGFAVFTEDPGGVRIRVAASNLSPGRHGVHIHEVARCDLPDFSSAGAHFNPTHRAHGLENPNGPHAGDLPNLEVGADGRGTADVVTDRISLHGGPNSVFDEDGSALVIHAQPDDQRTDPAGGSGARVACGTIESTGTTR